MQNNRKLLRDLLLTLFRSNEDLYEAIDSLEYSQMHMLLASLPGITQSRIAFTLVLVEQLEASGLVGSSFFEMLVSRFPARGELVRSVEAAWAGGDTDAGELNTGPTLDAVEGLVTTTDVETQEKLMGDRATFLDVIYLAKGYEASKSVVKLRMKFSDGWFVGTAFLVSPTRLLTAFHNVEDKTGERASAITAIFDYEAAAGGAEAEGTAIECLIDTVQGEAEDDWAVIDIAEPYEGVTPLRFSMMPSQAHDRVAIIQHPGGLAKQVALHNNLVTFANETRLQYLTDTQRGSSGAPVFNSDWDVVALHHSGGDLEVPGSKDIVYRNQGTPIEWVKARMEALGVM